MTEKTQNNTNLDIPESVNKKTEYAAYILWNALPPMMRHPKPVNGVKMSVREFAEHMSIHDEEIIDLLEIKTKTAFAERFNVERGTLCDWDKLIAQRDQLSDIRLWAGKLARNVTLATYNHAIRKGNPGTLKLFYQVINSWVEKTEVHTPPLEVSPESQKQVDAAVSNYLNKHKSKIKKTDDSE